MKPGDPIVPPTLEVRVSRAETLRHNRWNAGYYEDRFRQNERKLKKLRSVPLDKFIPEELPDGSKGITYGQVGARKLSPHGSVRYLQVINIRDTGIDFSIKPDRVAEGSHNDPERSRVIQHDILMTNTAFRGTETLIGRCVVISRNYGRLNISQDIDRIRVQGVNPYYVGVFLKTRFGQLQIQRFVHGVDSQKINFGHVRSFLLPILPTSVQEEAEDQYLGMARCHDRAMAIKERILAARNIQPGRYGEAINGLANQNASYRRATSEAQERLKHLISELEAVLEGEQKKVRPYSG
jgi:hypothetical protein